MLAGVTAPAKRILVVYASQSGKTTAMAEAVEQGALREAGVEVVRLHGTRAGPGDLLAAQGLVFATPENFGYMAGAIKDFLDRSFYPAEGKVDNLPYAIVVSAGNDGSFAVQHIERIVGGLSLRKVADPIIVRGEPGEEQLEACRELGQTLAAGLTLGVF